MVQPVMAAGHSPPPLKKKDSVCPGQTRRLARPASQFRPFGRTTTDIPCILQGPMSQQ